MSWPRHAEYLHEMTVFPKGKHDDEADSTAQFLDWFKTPIPGWGILEYYRRCAQELEKQRKPPPLKTLMGDRLHGVARRAAESAAGRAAPAPEPQTPPDIE